MSEKRNRQRFIKEFKEDAVRLVLEQAYSGIEVARRLGVSPSNVTRCAGFGSIVMKSGNSARRERASASPRQRSAS